MEEKQEDSKTGGEGGRNSEIAHQSGTSRGRRAFGLHRPASGRGDESKESSLFKGSEFKVREGFGPLGFRVRRVSESTRDFVSLFFFKKRHVRVRQGW